MNNSRLRSTLSAAYSESRNLARWLSRYIRFNHCLFAAIFILSYISFRLSYDFRFDFQVPPAFASQRFLLAPYVAALQTFVFYLVRGHATNWRYIGIADVPSLVIHCFVSSVVIFLLSLFGKEWWVPRGVILMNFFLSVTLIGGARIGLRLVRERLRVLWKGYPAGVKKSCIIVGAGDAGEMIIREIIRNPESDLLIMALFDDDRNKWRQTVHGIRILGPVEQVADYTRSVQVDVALVAIPSADNLQMQRIYGLLSDLDLVVKTLPTLHEIIEGSQLTQLRDVNISDLLGREEVNIDTEQVLSLIADKTILVTGAGGSIGSELCRQILRRRPTALILMDRSENGLFHIHRKLLEQSAHDSITPLLCDITDEKAVETAFERHKPDLVFHAAAHKHVPIQELNPAECFRNNVGGMRILAAAAHRHNVSRFLLVSSDKAVNPTSVMGATKRVCEIYCQAFGAQSSTKFLAVRFGNVLASEGSVIPIFMDQIAKGGPVTVTHPDMRRYFMTIPEAVTLVLQAAAMGRSGQVMVLEMGRPIKILDIVRHLLTLMGKDESSVPIQYIGLRPGEKLFEELSFHDEVYQTTNHNKIWIFNQTLPGLRALKLAIEYAVDAMDCSTPPDEVRRLLKKLVPEYRYEDENSLNETSRSIIVHQA